MEQYSRMMTAVNNTLLPNSGGWSQLVSDPDNPRNVVIDQETSEDFVNWACSSNKKFLSSKCPLGFALVCFLK